MNRRMFLFLAALLALSWSPCLAAERPNILFAIADDWGLHGGAYGTLWVKTPSLDRIAREGVLFRNAYTPMAKCAPSRAIVLTGRHLWQNEEAGNHMAVFPTKLKSWPEVFMEKGWHVGFTGKGWGPGIANDQHGKPRLITGRPFQKRKATPPTSAMGNNDYAANFIDFLDAAPKNAPWCFWYGSSEPHRAYEFMSGVKKGGKKLADIDRVPAYWPDNETVRHDMLDYALEVEHADMHLGHMIAELEKRGELDNTLVIVTSDHGMPFPRVKGYAYHDSNHVPLAVRWPGGVKRPGRIIDDFVDFTDIAPTLLDYAGIAPAECGMMPITGRSWRPILESDKEGRIVAERDHVLIGKERTDVGRPHDWGYPIRGIVTETHLYLKNYEPARWPAGNPETGYLDTDGSPTKSLILGLGRENRADRYWRLNFGMRPLEELYDLRDDSDCESNLAADSEQGSRLKSLRERLETALTAQGDPRMFGKGEIFDHYPPTAGAGFYEKYLRGEKPKAGWVSDTDFEPAPIRQPNIVIILADDLGYADASCYGGKIQTPNIDRLANQGMRFTDAHTTSSVCSPTRYGLLTGRYNWRSKLQSGVLGGLSPRLIEPGRMTVASLLKQRGYHTAGVGKWHLGMDWALRPGGGVAELAIERREQVFNVDYSQPIKNGPNSVGFDYYFGISASLDMVPYTFIENVRVASLPTEDRDFLMMLERAPDSRTRKGPAAPGFEAEDVLGKLTSKAVEIIGRQAADARDGKPFLLYVPLASPHTPILPTKKWHGKSGINPYADFVMETDAAVGEILAALDEHQLSGQTLVFFTSDNGCSPQAKFDELAAKGHHPSGPLRGHKADLFEGGLRVPFIARWPGVVAAGSKSDELVCQADLLATIAEILGAKLPPEAAVDSFSFLSTLRTGAAASRDHLVSHSVNGSFAIRRGDWKLLLCPDSGGWSEPRPGGKAAAGLPPMQLYHLRDDLGERTNLIDRRPEETRELLALLERIVKEGRSTPGPRQQNQVPVDFRAHVGK